MRKLILAILLFQAVNAFGQTVSAEVSSDPLPAALSTSFAVPAIAIARDRTGVAIAWAGDGRISVGRLDATGHFTGPVRSIPATSSADPVAGAAPSLAAAPGGDGFILTWLELHLVNVALKEAAFCRLDAGLNPSAPALLPLAPPVNSPPIVRSGKTTTWITADRMAWRVRSDGSIDSALYAGVAATDMTVANDYPQVISSNVRNAGFSCNAQQGGCTNTSREAGWVCTESCRLYSFNYEIQFVSLYDVVTSYTFKFDSQSVPAIRSDGRDVLASWFVGDEAKGGSVAAAHLDPARFIDFARAIPAFRVIGYFGPDSGPTRPDIASDGERYVVVWRTATTTNASHDIVGASIDRAGTVIPFSIATSTDDERDPSVVAIGNGRFLVAYDKLRNGERRIAGRFVTFENRTRAVR